MCLVGKYTFDVITLCEYVNHCFQQQQNCSENNNVKLLQKKQSFCVEGASAVNNRVDESRFLEACFYLMEKKF